MGQTRDTDFLDGLRAIAAFWVLIAHCLIWGGYSGAIPNAKLAVAMFMVLSGYLMALTAKDFSQPAEWIRFYLRRLLRLAPLYYLTLAVVALSPWVREGYLAWGKFPAGDHYSPLNADFSARNLALHVSFLFGLSPRAATSTMLGDWSLSLEMQFYAAFPALWLAVRRWGALRVCAALALPCLAYWSAYRQMWPDPAVLPLQLPYFLAGLMAYEARRDPWPAAPALLFCLFEWPLYATGSLVVALTAAIIVVLDRYPVAVVRRVLANPPMKLGGDLSYGVYLVHPLFVAAFGFLRPPLWLLVPSVAAGALALSYLLNRIVERPAISMGGRIRTPRTS